MPQTARHFAQRLNQCLDEMDAPTNSRERAAILSKMIDIPKQQAWTFVEGQIIPDTDIVAKIANEFEVDVNWLTGK